jgi:hypothetical protein
MRLLIVTLLLTSLSAGTTFAEELLRPVSERAKHFRLVLGVEDLLTVVGYLDESTGTGKGYDRAVLDLDSDGTPESVQEFTSDLTCLGIERGTPLPFLRLFHDGADYEFTILGALTSSPRDGTWHSSWSIRKGGQRVSFMSSRAPLHDSAKAARDGKPIRLGPPFTFEFRTRIEGPRAVLDVKLKGPMGGNLDRAHRHRKTVKIRVELRKGPEVVSEGELDYG